jgi:transposase-like protein
MNTWDSEGKRILMKIIATEFGCKFCGAKSLIKYGTSKGVQYWCCKACRHKFADNDALPGMKTPIMEVGAALSMYYRGMSIDEIRRHLDQQYTDCPSDSTVYDWISRFTDEAVAKARKYKPKVGYVWVADETMLDIGGTKVWFWDLIDVKTRYLLASHLSYQRTAEHAKRFVEKGAATSLLFKW